MTSLFGTAAAAGAVGLTPSLSMTLAQRSVMSSLGIPAASLLGGNPALAVASILVTGATINPELLGVFLTTSETHPRKRLYSGRGTLLSIV